MRFHFHIERSYLRINQPKKVSKISKRKRGPTTGTVVFTGNRKVENVLIHHLQYDAEGLSEDIIDSASKSSLKKSLTEKVDWYDIRGMHDTELIIYLGKTFDIHPLVQETIVDINQRPKFEEYSSGIFIVLRSLKFDPVELKIKKEHVDKSLVQQVD